MDGACAIKLSFKKKKDFKTCESNVELSGVGYKEPLKKIFFFFLEGVIV